MKLIDSRRFPRASARHLLVVLAIVLSAQSRQAAGADAPDWLAPHKDLERLSFVPSQCKYFDRIEKGLFLNGLARQMFDRQGLVVVSQKHGMSFGEAYFQIYHDDLPVLITSDSILHVFHRSFDNMLLEMEERVLARSISDLLDSCHDELAKRIKAGVADENAHRDVDLYLTVGRRLLEPSGIRAARPARARAENEQDGGVHSKMNQDSDAERIISGINSLRLQDPLAHETTILFGGHRSIDYSQFQPRGHYTKSARLSAYFRALMWLGRADCGFYPLGADPSTSISADGGRQLRDAVLLTDLLTATNQLQSLDAIDHTLALLWGQSDNLQPGRFHKILDEAKIAGLSDLQDKAREEALRKAILKAGAAEQKIQSQVYYGAKHPGETVPPPALFQLLGQRFSVDSFVLANVVYDTVQTVDEQHVRRLMPHGADVMAALGSPESVSVLTDDLKRWRYEPQLSAARQYTAKYLADPPGHGSIADMWLSALRTLHADMTGVKNFPEAMQTRGWRLKQLNTQLASWAEMRHDGILAIKQSYTRHVECDYPAGFVEPYPEFYRQIGAMARRLAGNLSDFESRFQPVAGKALVVGDVSSTVSPARRHWSSFAATMARLQRLAEQELKGEKFSAEDADFLKGTVNIRDERISDGCDGFTNKKAYSGWYCDLLYPKPSDIDQFAPTVADVHTNSNAPASVLEAGAGPAEFAVVAVNNGDDRMTFVGPVSSYYEFTRSASDRLTDERFKSEFLDGREPERPAWISAFKGRAK